MLALVSDYNRCQCKSCFLYLLTSIQPIFQLKRALADKARANDADRSSRVTICHSSPWLVFNHNRREKTPKRLLSLPTAMEVDNERAVRHEEEENASEEGEGDDIQMNSDSSEEEPDDEMEAQRVRDGFIVDEATDSEEERREQRRKRRKKEKRRRREYSMLI